VGRELTKRLKMSLEKSLAGEFDFLPNHPAGVLAPLGWKAGTIYSGIKTYGEGKLDLGILASDVPAAVAGVFTTSLVKAAPVLISQEVVGRGIGQAVVFNAGNANACTGEQGLEDARTMAKLAGKKLDIAWQTVLITSTGIIGHLLPMDKVAQGLSGLEMKEGEAAGADASFAIMTTDSRPKRCVVRTTLGGKNVVIGGMCKGAAMIHPNMATMLAYVTTDAAATPAFLQGLLSETVKDSFNAITIDGDTSTNDTVLLLANGLAGNPTLGESASAEDEERFKAALNAIMIYLAKEIVRDGEGSTKMIEIKVLGARNKDEAMLAARTAAGSTLTKCAVYGRDPNWGRIIAAMGRSGAQFDPQKADIWIGEVALMLNGKPQPFDKAETAGRVLAGNEVFIKVDLHTGGEGVATAWGCDMTQEYVSLNSDYTT
jgi:glutamate N-acetyltransferase / amino-acid N-acetyltransferase